MRAEPSISPLTLGICCAVVAGALALAPGQVTSPMGAGRGADIVALEGQAMNPGQQPSASDDGPAPDGVIDEVEVLGRMTSRTESPEVVGGATTCTDACGGVQEPTVVQTGTASDEVGSDQPADEGRLPTDAPVPDAPATGTTGTDVTADTTTTGGSAAGTEDGGEIDSCRSPRAVAAREDGPVDVAPASPCSQGRDHEPCHGGDCAGGRASGATEG